MPAHELDAAGDRGGTKLARGLRSCWLRSLFKLAGKVQHPFARIFELD